MADRTNTFDWNEEDKYWRSNYRTRPYASTDEYETFQPGYRYGFESAHRYKDRDWNDVESDLRRDWDSYQYRGQSTWESIKASVRDAWDRVTGQRHVGAR